MTLITVQDGKIVMRDGKVGTEQACCCGGGDLCCRCCECASGDPPVLNGTATADGIQWSGWNGTEYTTFDVQLSGICCCCDLLTDVISGLTNGPSPATAENVGALFGGAMPGRNVDTGEPPLGGYVAWGATAACADYWAFLGVSDPCAGYPDPCCGSWCVESEDCFDCYDGIDGFKPLQSNDPFVEACQIPQCEWQGVFGIPGGDPNAWAGGWELVAGCPDPECFCPEPAEPDPQQGTTYFTDCGNPLP